MAIIDIKQILQNTSCTQSLDRFHRKYSNTFLVRATADLTEYDIATTAGPSVGASYHPQDTTAVATDKQVTLKEQTQEGNTWLLQVSYDSDGCLIVNPNPVMRPAVISGTYQQEKKAVTEDLSTPPEKVLNSSFEPFDKPVEIDTSRQRISIQNNYLYSTFDFAWLDTLSDTYNGAEFWGQAVGECKMDGISWQIKKENNVVFVEVTFTILVDEQFPFGPEQSILDQGYKEIDIITLERRTILDSQGVPLTKPVLLDGNGQQLADSAAPVYLQFKLLKQGDWSLLEAIVPPTY